MKNLNILCFFAIALIAGNLSAQTEAGKILISGASSFDLSFEKEKYKSDDGDADGDKTTSVDFEPAAGYFVIDNLAVGLSLPIGFSSIKQQDNDKSKGSSVMFMPFGRYYYGIEDNVKIFGQLALGFGSYTFKYIPDQGETVKSKYGLLGWGIDGGMALYLNEFVAVDLMLGYNSYREKAKENNNNNARTSYGSFGLSAGITICF